MAEDTLTFAINEAMALASLNAILESPHIVRFYNAWLEDNRLHLVVGNPHPDRVLPRQHQRLDHQTPVDCERGHGQTTPRSHPERLEDAALEADRSFGHKTG